MKARISARAVFALASASAIAVTGVIVAPAHAATKTTVVMTEPTPINSLNYGVNNMNLASNEDLTYPTGFGFYWANDQKQVVPNTKFGSWKIAKNSATDFEVAYTVNPGQIWDDGAPITGVDLLLSHVTSSGKYSIAAGLGDPQSKAGSAFDSGGYGGVYDSHVVGNPTLSADKMTLTVNQISTKGGTLVGFVNEAKILDHTFEGAADGSRSRQGRNSFTLEYPAGPVMIRLENHGQDWIQLTSITVPGIGSTASGHGMQDRDWALIRVFGSDTSAVTVSGLALHDGSYQAKVFDTTNSATTDQKIQIANGSFQAIGLPKDCVLAIHRHR